MSESKRSQSAGFEAYSDYQKAFGSDANSFDFFINSSADPFAPNPETFDSELDSTLAGLDTGFQVFSNPVFNFSRLEASQNAAPSVFTTSSDSTYDTVSTHSESFYNYPPYSPSDFSFDNLELDMEQVHTGSEYGGSVVLSNIDNDNDPTCFGQLPPTPPRSPMNKVYGTRSFPTAPCFSEYPTGGNPDQFFSPIEYANGSVVLATVATGSMSPVPTALEDQRKKHKCPKCTRAFARAFNLKTHMATHDPNRLKPHTCPHRNCGRSFSRKHDLGRHLTSIHRDEGPGKRIIGVAKVNRSWCDGCGKSSGGRCSCADVK